MDSEENSLELVSLSVFILTMLLNCQRALEEFSVCVDEEEVPPDFGTNFGFPLLYDAENVGNVQRVSEAALQQWRIWTSLSLLEEDLGFWVKPRSTAWFSKFLLEEYDDERWIRMFRFTKKAVFHLAEILTPNIRKRDTNYRHAVPVVIRLGCALFNLTQGASLLICSELFAVGKSTVSILLRDVVNAINEVLKKEIMWPTGERIASTANDFQRLCGLPAVLGAIDGTHFAISKPKFGPVDYYYFKSGGYAIQCQAVVDSSKRFLNLHVGMPGSTNDSRVLRRSTLFHRGVHNNLWEGRPSMHGFSPYLLGDAGYPLLPWLMTPHRLRGNLSVSERLFNRKLSQGRAVVENAFALLKQTFRELHKKTELHVTFVPDVVVGCGLLHNLLLQQSHEEVEALLQVLRDEGLQEESDYEPPLAEDADAREEVLDFDTGRVKRNDLSVFLTLQRINPA